jgi:hypothetical protein
MYNLVMILTVYALSMTAVAYANHPLRDPTRPPNTTSYAALGNTLRIDAIFFNKDNANKSTVIIEGRKFMLGDKINDATLVEIKPHEIKLQDDKGEFTVNVPYTIIKSPITKTNKKQTT